MIIQMIILVVMAIACIHHGIHHFWITVTVLEEEKGQEGEFSQRKGTILFELFVSSSLTIMIF